MGRAQLDRSPVPVTVGTGCRQAADAVGEVAEMARAPSRALALARSVSAVRANRAPEAASEPSMGHDAGGAAVPGPVEATLADLGVTDPAMLARGAGIDHDAERRIVDAATRADGGDLGRSSAGREGWPVRAKSTSSIEGWRTSASSTVMPAWSRARMMAVASPDVPATAARRRRPSALSMTGPVAKGASRRPLPVTGFLGPAGRGALAFPLPVRWSLGYAPGNQRAERVSLIREHAR